MREILRARKGVPIFPTNLPGDARAGTVNIQGQLAVMQLQRGIFLIEAPLPIDTRITATQKLL